MTLTELRYLVNLARERNFGRAAERCFVTQPTLSVAIKKLEDRLGVVLFERGRGQVRPTPVGERIVEQARRVLAEAALIEDLAREGRDELVGPLRLGAIYTVAPYLLPGLVPLLRRRAPRMPLVIEENFTAVLLEQLHDADLDIAVLALPIDDTGLSVWPIYEEPFVALVPPEHEWAGRDAVRPAELAGQQLLLLGPGHCFRDQVIEACPGCTDPAPGGLRPVTGSSLETIRHMVASGLGITVVPRSSVAGRPEEPGGLVSVPLIEPTPMRTIALVWRRSWPRHRAVQTVREVILEAGVPGARMLPDAEPSAPLCAAHVED